MDMLLSTGERISCALCAMAINDLGRHALSLTGSQAGIVTDDVAHQGPDPRRARRAHQARRWRPTGSSSSPASRASPRPRDVTTLGRGGSDTSAVALAAALGAEECEIYTDVAGVFRPTRGSSRTRASSTGCPSRRCSRCLLRAPGCFSCAPSSTPATTVCGSTAAPPLMTLRYLCGLKKRRRWSSPSSQPSPTRPPRLGSRSVGVPDEPGAAARIFQGLAAANVNVDMIVQNEPTTAGGLRRDLLERSPAMTCVWAREALEALQGLVRSARLERLTR